MNQRTNQTILRQRAIVLVLLLSLLLGLLPPLLAEPVHAAEEEPQLTQQEGMELIPGDAVARQTMQELKASQGAVLFESSALAQAASQDADEMKVKLTYSKKIYYEDFFTRNYRCEFRGKKVVAYCIQPKETPPAEGTHTATEFGNRAMVKALYYMYGYPGYAKKVQAYVSKKDKDDDWEDDDSAYALCHMILSYLYDKGSMSSDAFLGVSAETKRLVVKVADYVETLPDAPTDTSLSFSKSQVDAVWDWDKSRQKTPSIKLNTHEDNRISLTVPKNCTLHRTSDGATKTFASGKTVKIYGGDSFYLTAPKSVSGTWKSGTLEGSLASFSPYLIAISGKQNIFFCGKGDTGSVSLSVHWVSWGFLQGKKYCEDEAKAKDGLQNVYEHLRFQITGNGMPDPIRLQVNRKGELTDENGATKIELLAGGPYTIRETAQDSRYREKASTTFSITGGETHQLPERALSNVTKKGRMQLNKLWIDPDTSIESSVIHREQGVVFRIWDAQYAGKGWKFEDVPELFRDTLTTNQEGAAQSKELPVGEYLVQQATKDNTNWAVKDFTITITAKENGDPETKTIDLVNKPAQNRFAIEKVDAESGKPVKEAGIQFQVRDEKGRLVTQRNDQHETIDTFVTGADGIARSPETIQAGSYAVTEVKAPNGYVRESEPVPFQVTSDTKPGEIVKVVLKDTPQKGILHLQKYGQVLAKTDRGKELQNRPMAFVQFKLRAAEDIVTGDGTVHYQKGQEVETLLTDEAGKAASKPQYLGSYQILETGIYEKERTYSLTDADIASILERWVDAALRADNRPPGQEEKDAFTAALGKKLTARYVMNEQQRYFEIPKGDPEFSYTEAQQWALQDFAASVPKEQIQDGFVEADASAYQIPKDGLMKTVKLEYGGQDAAVTEASVTIVNELGMGEAELTKTDLATGKVLPGARIELFDAKKELVASGETDAKGNIRFPQLPVGQYFLKETAAPEGYVLDSRLHPFEIKAHGEIVKCSITNRPMEGGVQITKTDVADAAPLPGATITLYDQDKKQLQSGKTDVKGIVTFEQLRPGSYYFRETAAPEGYVLDRKLHPFTIKEDGEIVKCTITNRTKPTTFTIHKVSASDGRDLEGAVFGLYDADKRLLKKQTSDSKGRMIFEELEPGSYYYKELQAPKGYTNTGSWRYLKLRHKGEQITVTVQNRSLTHTAVQTGDAFPLLPLAGLLLAAGGAAIWAIRRKHKRNRR